MIKCLICNQNTQQIEIKEQMFGMNEKFLYNQCIDCGHTKIDNAPNNLEKYYNNNIYYSYNSNNPKTFNNIKEYFKKILFKLKISNNFIFSKSIKPILGLRELNTNMRILDYGCGDGSLVNELKKLGVKNSCGYDLYLSNEDSDLIRTSLTNNINDINSQKWNLITLNHVFEHFIDPAKSLRSIIELLLPNGKLILRFPVIDSYAFRIYQKNWVQFDAPRHINLFTRNSFKKFMQNFPEMSIEKMYDDSFHFQFTGSEIYKKNKTLISSNSKLKRIFSIKTYLYHFKAKALNGQSEGDQIVVILKKK